MSLTGRNIYLKRFSEENLADPAYAGWLTDPETARWIRFEYLVSLDTDDLRAHVRELMRRPQTCFFAVYARDTDAFIGTHKIDHIELRAGRGDMGIMIGHRGYRGKGLSADIMSVGCAYAFEELGLRKLTGGTAATNIPMIRCFEKLGFKREGLLRQQLKIQESYVDHALYGLLREEWKK